MEDDLIILSTPIFRPSFQKDLADCSGAVESRTDNDEEADEQEEASCCPICFEPWTSSGKHRIVSLKCGHLFGRSCIEKWLNHTGTPKCPQCNALAKKSDLRVLFVSKRLVAVESSGREDALMQQIDEERRSKRLALEREAALAQELAFAKAEVIRLKEVNAQMKLEKIMTSTPAIDRRVNFTFFKHSSLGDGCRCLLVDDHYRQAIVSRNNQLIRISLDTLISAGAVPVTMFSVPHEKGIKGMASSKFKDGLLASVGLDCRLKLASLQSGSMVAEWGLPTAGWAVAFDILDRNLLFVGLANRRISVYDLRQTDRSLIQSIVIDSGQPPMPVHSLFTTQSNNRRVIVGATMNGIFVSEISDSQEISPQLILKTITFPGVSGTCIGMSVAEDSKSFIASFRQVNPSQPAQIIVFKVNDEENEVGELVLVKHFQSASGHMRMLSPIIYRDLSKKFIIGLIDEPSNSVHLWKSNEDSNDTVTLYDTISCSTTRALQSIAYCSSTKDPMIIALTDQNLFLYR